MSEISVFCLKKRLKTTEIDQKRGFFEKII
jgi:hypothetical protein